MAFQSRTVSDGESLPSEPAPRGWVTFFKNALVSLGLISALVCIYGLSLGPVMRHYKTHPPIIGPGVVLYTPKGTPQGAEQRAVSVTFPKWLFDAYRPAFSLLMSGEGANSLGGVYRRYWRWCVDQKSECLSNLRLLNEAKRKWAAEAHKADGATPFAAHIIDYLPDRSMPRCPDGGVYHFNSVGTKPECSVHGDTF